MKYYAVKKGRKTGVFTSWNETEKLVKGYPGAKYKSFKNREEAEDFIGKASATQLDLGPINSKSKPKAASRKHESAENFDFSDVITEEETIILYTDGGSRNHGNHLGGHVKASDKAAWAYLILTETQQVSNSGGEFGATNNRMEIMGLLQALNYLITNDLEKEKVTVITDSKYVLDAITKGWLAGWKRKGWKRGSSSQPTEKQTLKNRELWQQIDANLGKFRQLNFKWTKGHASNEGNNFVDELLNETMDRMGKADYQASLIPKIEKRTMMQQAKSAKTQDPSDSKPSSKRIGQTQGSPVHEKMSDKTKKSVQDVKAALRQMGLFDDK